MTTLTTLFKALSDESRLRILNLLFSWGELCVCDIEQVMGFTQTKVSRHLAYLRRARLVVQRRQGLWKLYSLARPLNAEHATILEALGSVLRSSPIAGKDAQKLSGCIRRGCCMSVGIATSETTPTNLKQRHPKGRNAWTPSA
jgi:ArsR family transcriptional regulator